MTPRAKCLMFTSLMPVPRVKRPQGAMRGHLGQPKGQPCCVAASTASCRLIPGLRGQGREA